MEEPPRRHPPVARILVAGTDGTLAQRTMVDAVVQRLRHDGHDGVRFGDLGEGPVTAVRDCDAVVALLDDLGPGGATAIAFARAADKPCLGLASTDIPPILAELTHTVEAQDVEVWWRALPGFYDEVRPFAGRVVRDRIPDLVKEAGHDVKFRRLEDDERPRFLKQKVANEAKELLAADMGDEKEEVADVLEALEAFIRSRGFDRDELRRVKDAKRKRRGGFERCFIVEATNPEPAPQGAAPQDPAPDPQAPAATRTARPSAAPDAAPAGPPTAPDTPRPRAAPDGPAPGTNGQAPQRDDLATAETIDFEFDDEPTDDGSAPEDLMKGRDVRADFRDL